MNVLLTFLSRAEKIVFFQFEKSLEESPNCSLSSLSVFFFFSFSLLHESQSVLEKFFPSEETTVLKAVRASFFFPGKESYPEREDKFKEAPIYFS